MVEEQLCSNKSLLLVCVLITFNIIMTNPGNRSSNANGKIDYFHRCTLYRIKMHRKDLEETVPCQQTKSIKECLKKIKQIF